MSDQDAVGKSDQDIVEEVVDGLLSELRHALKGHEFTARFGKDESGKWEPLSLGAVALNTHICEHLEPRLRYVAICRLMWKASNVEIGVEISRSEATLRYPAPIHQVQFQRRELN